MSSFGVAAAKKKGVRVIPATLFMIGLLKILPNGKSVPLVPETGKDDAYRSTLTELFEQCAAGDLNPVIAARIPHAEARRVHELLERGKYAGKVVLIASDQAKGEL